MSIMHVDSNYIYNNNDVKNHFVTLLLRNCRSNDYGTLIASPDTDPNYRYEWMRDSALIVTLLLDLVSSAKFDIEYDDVRDIIEKYIENQYIFQNLCYEDRRDLGEPKV